MVPSSVQLECHAATQRAWASTVTVALAWRSRVARAELAELRDQARELARVELLPRVDQWLPTVRAETLAGDSVTIGEVADGRNQVLLFFTAQCPYCLRTVPAWRKLHDALVSELGGPDVIWISLSSRDSTAEYVRQHGIRPEAVAFPPDHKMKRVMRARSVPVTVVLDHRGKVSYVRAAVLGSDAAIDSVRVAATPIAARDGRDGRESP
jgi:peroxiredoxin